jgi:hypothetical protein
MAAVVANLLRNAHLLMQASGIETPTRADLARLNWRRKQNFDPSEGSQV